MTTTKRARAILGVDKKKVGPVQTRAQAMYNGMEADKVTYAAANPPLPAFLTLIQNLASSQQVVPTRVTGAAALRNEQRALLITGMESELMFVQGLADASPSRAVSIIQNAGLVVAATPAHVKLLLTLALTKQPGSVACDANVGLLVGARAAKPSQRRFFNWGYTLDGGKTFVAAPSTPTGKTTIGNLPLLTMVGVRVNLNNMSGPGEWSQVVTILVH
jgi:hypothetical protein